HRAAAFEIDVALGREAFATIGGNNLRGLFDQQAAEQHAPAWPDGCGEGVDQSQKRPCEYVGNDQFERCDGRDFRRLKPARMEKVTKRSDVVQLSVFSRHGDGVGVVITAENFTSP